MSAILESVLSPERIASCKQGDRIDKLLDEQGDRMGRFLDDQLILRNATVYKARRGARKPFRTPADALAYETGWDAQKEGLTLPAGPGPESQGWLDAEREDVDAREVRDDERRERAERS